jgi:phage FluMu protein Com
MPFRFYCTHCRQRLSVSSRKRGQEVKCPRCRRVTKVPDREQSTEDESKEATQEENVPLPSVSTPDELVYADEVEHNDHPPTGPQQVVSIPRYVLYTQGFLLGAVALVFFVFGLIVGSRSSGDGASTKLQSAIVSGTVLVQNGAKGSTPDEGSVVVLLPATKRPDEKAASTGLGPDDPQPDEDHQALAMLRSLGGDYTRADRKGRYQVRVPTTGRYYLLVISRSHRRSENEQPKPSELAQLGRYFLPATELLANKASSGKRSSCVRIKR